MLGHDGSRGGAAREMSRRVKLTSVGHGLLLR